MGQQRFLVLRWLAVPAMVVLLAAGLWTAFKASAPVPDSRSLADVGTTLELGNNMTRSMAVGLLAPLSEELDRVNRDLDTTAQFLLASVP